MCQKQMTRREGPLEISPDKLVSGLSKAIGAAFWAVLILLCLVHREDITVSGILNYIPEDRLAAVLVLFGCFALKSLTVFMYSGVIYAASGIMFPLPMAIAVNVAGTVIMATVPYLIGRGLGGSTMEKLAAGHPKLQSLREFQGENEIVVTFFVRMVGLIPGDLAAMYSGACRAKYSHFLTGTLLGMLPMILLFSLMGMSVDDPTSPVFVVSVIIKVLLAFLSALWFSRWKKRRGP